MLVSEAFANVDGMRYRLVSVGRYALRGVAQPQELFTLDSTRLFSAIRGRWPGSQIAVPALGLGCVKT